MSESQSNHPTNISDTKRQGPRSSNHRSRRPQTNRPKSASENQHQSSTTASSHQSRATNNETHGERPQNAHRRHRRPRRTNQPEKNGGASAQQRQSRQNVTNEKQREPHSEHSEQKNAHRNDAKRSEMTRSDRNEHSRNQSARPNKPNVTKDTHAKRPQVRKNTGSAHQSEATKPVTPVVPVRSEEATTVRANLTDAFVDHETKPLVPQHRQALHVFVRNLRQVRQLRRFGDIDYISKKLHYVVIYMNQDDIEKNQQAISKLSFVRRVMVSERPEVDPFVGHGVNANFVTHTENDGAADALSKLQSEPTDPSKTTTEEN